MKRIKRYFSTVRWFIVQNVFSFVMAFFYFTISASFLIIFISTGLNVYEEVKQKQDELEGANQILVRFGEDADAGDIITRIENAKCDTYSVFYTDDSVYEESGYSIALYDFSNSKFFQEPENKVFKEKYLDLDKGVIVSEKVASSIEENEIVITTKNENKRAFPISAVISSESDCVLNSNLNKDIYIPIELLEDNTNAQICFIAIENGNIKLLNHELENMDCFIMTNNNLNEITTMVGVIRWMICFFGIVFCFVASISVLDVIALILTNNMERYFTMLSVGFSANYIKKMLYSIFSIISVLASLAAYVVCKILQFIIVPIEKNNEIFGVEVSRILSVRITIVPPTLLILFLCVIMYTCIALRKLNNENIVMGLNGME